MSTSQRRHTSLLRRSCGDFCSRVADEQQPGVASLSLSPCLPPSPPLIPSLFQFIIQAVEVVTQAIEADKEGDYEKALQLYRKSLDYFMTGLVLRLTLLSANIFLD
jgi:hypothetical protein